MEVLSAGRGEPELDQVDFCVTTFERPRAIERLLLSIGAHYPTARVHIADQGNETNGRFYDDLTARTGLARRPEIHRLDFDCGLSAARNHLVTSTSAPYKLLLDDDFVVTEETRVELMAQLLSERPDVGIVGGAEAHGGCVRHVRQSLHMKGDTLLTSPHRDAFQQHRGIRYASVDYVCNFILARRELFQHVLWDPALKLFEHDDFYLRVKSTPYAVLFTPDAVIDHVHVESGPEYKRFRWRLEYIGAMMRKHQIRRKKVGSSVLELRPDGTLHRYVQSPDDEAPSHRS